MRVALKVTLALIGVTVLAFGAAVAYVLYSDTGRSWLEQEVESRVAAAFAEGVSVRLVGLRVVPLGQLHLDSLILTDSAGARVGVLNNLKMRYAIRTLFDQELYVRSLFVDRAELDLRQDTSGAWNTGRLFAASGTAGGPPSGGAPWRFRVDTMDLADASATITRPSDTLRLRDLSLALGASDFRSGTQVANVAIAALSGTLDDPALRFRTVGGRFALHEDSLLFDFPVLEANASRAALVGHLVLPPGSGDPQVDLQLRAQPLQVADIAFLSPLLPRSAVVSGLVRVINGSEPGTYRAELRELDVQSPDSRLRGRLVAVLRDTLEIRDLDITAAPLDLRLLREILGDSVPPPPWDGAVRGRLRATGGPLHRFVLRPSSLEFEDRRVDGAQSRLTLSGTLNLVASDVTLAPLSVRLDSMDIRTIGAAVEVADSLQGYLTGALRLDGPVTHLRFRDLDLTHVDADLPTTRVRGEGFIAQETERTWLDAQLTLDSVGIASVGRAFSSEVLAGSAQGTLNVSAIRDSVALDLTLQGEGADLVFRGATSLDSTRRVLRGDLAVWNLNLRPFLPELEFPAHALTASATLGIDGSPDEASGPVSFTIDSTSRVAGIALHTGHGQLVLEPGGIRVDTLMLAGALGHLEARGRLSRDPALRDTLRFTASLDSVALLRGFLPDSLAEAWTDSLGGRATLRGVALGSLDTLDIRAEVSADSLRAGSYGVVSVEADVLLDGLPEATRGLVTMRARDIAGAGIPVHSAVLEATVREARWADISARIVAGDTLVATARADIHYMVDSLEVRLDSLTARSRDADWSLVRTSHLFQGPDRTVIDSLEMRSADGARFALDARLDSAGPIALTAQAVRVPLAHARFTRLIPAAINGLLTLDATVSGTVQTPEIHLTAAFDSGQINGEDAPGMRAQLDYADRVAVVEGQGQLMGADAFTVAAELPVDLALEARPTYAERLLEGPIYMRLAASAAPLEGIGALIPGVRNLQGGMDADIQVTGTWKDPEPRGIVLIREAAFAVPALRTGFRDALADISFTPDSVVIYRARVADERSLSDTASVEGAVIRTDQGWRADIRTVARNLRVIDDPRVAEADVSWQLRLRGPLNALTLGGDVMVPQANVFIGRQERRALQLDEDEAASAEAARYAPRLEGLRVRLGNEVRLRSPEANVQLTGEVAVTGTLDEPDVRGEIFAARGTYRLNLGLLQRTFTVDSGFVRLNGPLSNPPTLDIRTSYVVRQSDREDVVIGARLTGTVEEPRLTLSSNDLGTTANETQIISYLLFGAPTFALDGQSASAVRLATAALVPSLGGAAERALGARLPFLSELQVVTVAGDSPQDFTLNSFEGLLNSFALTAGTQIGTDSYLRLSGGVCRGENRAAQSLPAWFGVAAEYRPRERLSAELSLAPGSAPCNRIGTFTQIYQLGLDLYRDWRW